eukprot:7383898-Prymnesium_polylepis.2
MGVAQLRGGEGAGRNAGLGSPKLGGRGTVGRRAGGVGRQGRRRTARVEHDVLRLEVAVHDLPIVQEAESRDDARAVEARLGLGQL